MNKQIMNNLQKSLHILLAATALCAFVFTPLLASAQEDESVESVFVVWKGGNFHKFVVEKNLDYSKYKKVIVFPLKSNQLQIDTGNNVRMARNWANFVEEDMSTLAEKFDEVIAKEFSENKSLVLTETGGSDVVIAAVNMLTFTPQTYRDSSIETVGKESFDTVGILGYQITLLDSESGLLVGFIEDEIKITLRKSALNIRSNHVRAWSLTFELIAGHLRNNLKELAKDSPLSKK